MIDPETLYTKEGLLEDLKQLAEYYVGLCEGGDTYESAYKLMYSYGLTDKDGFWIG